MQATINNVQMHWRESGSGDAVVLLHAFPLHSGMWEEQLGAMPEGWHVIAPDYRGFGRSASVGAGPYTMELLADDVFGMLDRIGHRHAVLCGLSMGGYVALSAFRKYADRIRGLILCNTRAGADSPEAKQGRIDLAAKVRQEGSRAVVNAMLPKLISDQAREANPDLTAVVQQMMTSNNPESIARALEGMAQRPGSEDLFSSINCPVLIIHSDDDAVIPRGEAQMMARGIRGARLQMIPEAGHLSNLERPSLFNRYVSDYLQNMPPFFGSLKLA